MKKESFFYLEVTGIGCSVLGFFLKLAKFSDFATWLLGFGFGMLAVLYLMYIILPHRQGQEFLAENISKYLVSITFGIFLFGIIGLFLKLSLINIGQTFLELSTYAHLILVIVLLFALRIADNIMQFESTKALLVRALVMLSVVFMFFLTPKSRLEKVFKLKEKLPTTENKF